MFLFGKKKKKKQTAERQKPSREELIAQATANAKKAREAIGQDTLDRIAEAMEKKQRSAIEQAKRQIRSEDDGKVADHLKFMIDEDRSK